MHAAAIARTCAVIALCVASCASDPAGGDDRGGGDDSGDDGGGDDSGADGGDGDDDGAADPTACASIFDEDTLPRFDLALSPEERAALEAEFRAPLATFEATGAWPTEMPKTYHPLLELRHGDEVVTDAEVRLKGSTSWQTTIRYDGDLAKMQFVVSFNEVDRDGRFHGLRKLELDAPRHDPTLLRQRLALAYLRDDLGVPAQCASSAEVYLDGEYYGLFTLTERLDKEFLQRNFPAPGDDDGDLFERGYVLETNEATASRQRRNDLFRAADVEDMAELADVDASIKVWAGEAMMPDGDGYYGGTHNFFLYDHPGRGFLWLPYDLDATFSHQPTDLAPVFWSRAEQPGLHYLLVANDPVWSGRYDEAICDAALGAYDVDRLRDRVTRWSAQIAGAIAADPRFRFSDQAWAAAVDALAAHVEARRDFVTGWCACRAGEGGASVDADGDGAPWCRDAADDDPAVHPGAVEACGDHLDDDGDGWIDEGC
jgi:hypothetical protein